MELYKTWNREMRDLKEEWKEKTYIFYNTEAAKTKWNYIIKKYAVYEGINRQFDNSVKVKNLSEFLEEKKLHKTANFLLQIHTAKLT